MCGRPGRQLHVPEAFSFSLIQRGRRLLPRTHDVMVLTTDLVEALEADELRAAVYHEVAHIRHGDHRYLPFLHVLASLLFFDPVLRIILSKLHRHHEFAADGEAARRAGNPLVLARALLKTATHAGPARPIPQFVFRHHQRLLFERIERLLRMAEAQGLYHRA